MEEQLQTYTVKEVCGLLKISRNSLYTLMKNGKLHGTKVGRSWRFTRAEIDFFLNGNTDTTDETNGETEPEIESEITE